MTAPDSKKAPTPATPVVELAEGPPARYDAILLVGFGGPEGPEEVMPFLRQVTRGRNVPDERLAVVAEHYYARGGVSPINEIHRQMLGEIRSGLAGDGIEVPVYWGNRNAAPMLDEVVKEIAEDGHERVLAFVTSAYSSYSGCRQYREDLARAQASMAMPSVTIEKLGVYFDHPGFVEPLADGLRAALDQLDSGAVRVLFSAHSIPVSMANGCRYQEQLRAVADHLVSAESRASDYRMVWQSRSGPPQMPWLEPDINDAIAQAAQDGVEAVVVVPYGFVSDHMEVLQDLDTEAAATASSLGLGFVRSATPGADPRFIDMIVSLVGERLSGSPDTRLAIGQDPEPLCHESCCPAPVRGGPPR